MMRSRRHQNGHQLVLQLERQNPQIPAVKNIKGLVEALADLLLEALEADRKTKTGGEDEHEDHA
jgi:predicted fused transcriptional regulator/phosphomethylpyrimidine kinase